jgi:hypothetical protein
VLDEGISASAAIQIVGQPRPNGGYVEQGCPVARQQISHAVRALINSVTRRLALCPEQENDTHAQSPGSSIGPGQH